MQKHETYNNIVWRCTNNGARMVVEKKHKWNTKSINLPKKLKTLHKKQTKIEMWEARNIKKYK